MHLIDSLIQKYPNWVKKFDEKHNYDLRKDNKIDNDDAAGEKLMQHTMVQKNQIKKLKKT